MGLPHLNKDVAATALMRSGLPYEVANERAFRLVYGTAQTWLAASMSFVIDMTMYPEYSPAEVESLRPHGTIVHVHTRARDALERWEAKMRILHPIEAEAVIAHGRPVQAIATDSLDFGCLRVDVDTTDGYDPTLEAIVAAVEAAHG